MNYYNDSYYYNDYLQHYGVPGMKWGRRKARQLTTGVKRMTRRTADGLADMGAGAGLVGMHLKKKGYGTKTNTSKVNNTKPANSKQVVSSQNKIEKKTVNSKKTATGDAAAKKAMKQIGKQAVAGLAMTAAGAALRASGKESVGSMLSIMGTSYLVGTAVGTAVGGSLYLANKKQAAKK